MKDLTGQEMPPETVAYLKSHTLSVLAVCAVGLAARYGVFGWLWVHPGIDALMAAAFVVAVRATRRPV